MGKDVHIIDINVQSGIKFIFSRKAVAVLTALRREAIQLVEQMPEEQMTYVIQYIHMLEGNKAGSGSKEEISPKMQAFMELEKMLFPVSQEIDYDKELAEARDERYGYFS